MVNQYDLLQNGIHPRSFTPNKFDFRIGLDKVGAVTAGYALEKQTKLKNTWMAGQSAKAITSAWNVTTALQQKVQTGEIASFDDFQQQLNDSLGTIEQDTDPEVLDEIRPKLAQIASVQSNEAFGIFTRKTIDETKATAVESIDSLLAMLDKDNADNKKIEMVLSDINSVITEKLKPLVGATNALELKQDYENRAWTQKFNRDIQLALQDEISFSDIDPNNYHLIGENLDKAKGLRERAEKEWKQNTGEVFMRSAIEGYRTANESLMLDIDDARTLAEGGYISNADFEHILMLKSAYEEEKQGAKSLVPMWEYVRSGNPIDISDTKMKQMADAVAKETYDKAITNQESYDQIADRLAVLSSEWTFIPDFTKDLITQANVTNWQDTERSEPNVRLALKVIEKIQANGGGAMLSNAEIPFKDISLLGILQDNLVTKPNGEDNLKELMTRYGKLVSENASTRDDRNAYIMTPEVVQDFNAKVAKTATKAFGLRADTTRPFESMTNPVVNFVRQNARRLYIETGVDLDVAINQAINQAKQTFQQTRMGTAKDKKHLRNMPEAFNPNYDYVKENESVQAFLKTLGYSDDNVFEIRPTIETMQSVPRIYQIWVDADKNGIVETPIQDGYWTMPEPQIDFPKEIQSESIDTQRAIQMIQSGLQLGEALAPKMTVEEELRAARKQGKPLETNPKPWTQTGGVRF